MLIYRTVDTFLDSQSVVALGCFDGVHIGHMAVIKEAQRVAKMIGYPLSVFTFDTPPRNFFLPDSVPVICTPEEKLSLFEAAGVDISVCVPFDETMVNTSAEDFINDILIGRMRAAYVVCGYNYTFGKKGTGNAELIRAVCERSGIGVSIIPEQTLDGVSVSSSLIRSTVMDGDMEYAAALLGRPFFLTSRVVDGQHLARRLGFPTVNTLPPSGHLLPKRGVYVTMIRFDKEKRYGITNVGIRPTVDTNILCAETHIFDFDGDLYGKDINVEFLHFLREERRFNSVEEMSVQVKNDIETAKHYISKQDIQR